MSKAKQPKDNNASIELNGEKYNLLSIDFAGDQLVKELSLIHISEPTRPY